RGAAAPDRRRARRGPTPGGRRSRRQPRAREPRTPCDGPDRPAGRRARERRRATRSCRTSVARVKALSVDGIERVLCVLAHPDDVDFGFAGSVAVMTDGGIDVSYCIVTDGEAGGAETGIPRAEMAARRRDEQRKAAAVVGVQDVHFLGYPDGR